MKAAEEFNYWQTTVGLGKSQGEIVGLLEDFGADSQMIAQGQARGEYAWLVRFSLRGASYRFVFIPLKCRAPDKISSFGGKRRAHRDQARHQMGRIAVHFTKAILTAAEAQPHALFGFLELPAVAQHPGGLPVTAGELDVAGLVSGLPELRIGDGSLLLVSGN